MSHINHPYCLRLAAICLGKHPERKKLRRLVECCRTEQSLPNDEDNRERKLASKKLLAGYSGLRRLQLAFAMAVFRIGKENGRVILIACASIFALIAYRHGKQLLGM